MKKRITDRFLSSLPKADRDVRIADDLLAGFGVLVRAGGRISYFLDSMSGGCRERTTFGKFPDLPVAAAREHAEGLRRTVAKGGSLRAPAPEPTLNALLPTWLESIELTRRRGTFLHYDAHCERFISPSFGHLTPREVRPNDIELWHARIGRKTKPQANRVLATLSSFMVWAKRAGLIDVNPCVGLKRFEETGRQTYLDAMEMNQAEAFLLLQTGDRRSAALTILLALLTGSRIGEACDVRSHTIDWKNAVWVKPSRAVKQDRQHIVPLPTRAVDVLRELLELEPSTERQRRAVLAGLRVAVGRGDIRLHDLRHSRASALVRSGASLPVVGRVLGHSAPQTTARYAHLHHDDVRAVLELSTQEPPALRAKLRRA